MNKEWLLIISKRFVKMFLIGGTSSVLLAMAGNPLTDLTQLKSWILILLTAFITGGLAAFEKWVQGYNPQ